MIRSLLAATLRKLRPDGAELFRLVTLETDAASYHRFEQIAPGPVAAVAALAALGLYGAVAAPFRLLRRMR